MRQPHTETPGRRAVLLTSPIYGKIARPSRTVAALIGTSNVTRPSLPRPSWHTASMPDNITSPIERPEMAVRIMRRTPTVDSEVDMARRRATRTP